MGLELSIRLGVREGGAEDWEGFATLPLPEAKGPPPTPATRGADGLPRARPPGSPKAVPQSPGTVPVSSDCGSCAVNSFLFLFLFFF